MAQAENDKIPSGIKSVYPPILLVILVGLLIYWANDYGETARRLPLLIGAGTLVFIVLDFISRFRGKFGALIRLSLGAGFQDPEMKHSPKWQSEIMQLVWVAFSVTGIVLIGILPTVPIFVFLYMLIQGRQNFLPSLMVSVLTVFVVTLVFEVLLEYDLYRGLLFNQDGLE
jgi:hypothetical protein